MKRGTKTYIILCLCLCILSSCSNKVQVKANDIGDIGNVASSFDFRKETYYSDLDRYLSAQYPDIEFTRFNEAPFGGTSDAGDYYVATFDKARVYKCWYVANPDILYPVEASGYTYDYTSDYDNMTRIDNTYEESKAAGVTFSKCIELLPDDCLIASNLVNNPGYIEVYTRNVLTEEQLRKVINADIGIVSIYARHTISDKDYNNLKSTSRYYVSTQNWEMLYSPYSGIVSRNLNFEDEYQCIKVNKEIAEDEDNDDTLKMTDKSVNIPIPDWDTIIVDDAF